MFQIFLVRKISLTCSTIVLNTLEKVDDKCPMFNYVYNFSEPFFLFISHTSFTVFLCKEIRNCISPPTVTWFNHPLSWSQAGHSCVWMSLFSLSTQDFFNLSISSECFASLYYLAILRIYCLPLCVWRG